MSLEIERMLKIPTEVLTSGVLVHLSIRDLQAVNVAFTSTPTHRAQIKELWKSYPYKCPDRVGVTLDDLKWMKSVGVKPVGLIVSNRKECHEILSLIASTFSTLRLLKLHSKYIFDRPNDASLIKLGQGCPLLEVLDIPLSHVTDAGFLALAQNCRQLHTLSLQNYFPNDLQDNVIRIICSHCPHLKHIALSHCHNLTDASLIVIANSYPHLESINLRYWNFTDDGLIYFADKCHELQSVSVRCDNITSRGLTALWAANPNLMDVDISLNNFTSDDDIIQLAQSCPFLQKLVAVRCRHITDVGVIAVAEHCPQLRSLDIYGCRDVSDASLIALGQHCQVLKSINISDLVHVSDVGIAALAAGCPLLQEFYAFDTNITDAGVISLARGCRDLRIVVVQRCKLVGIAAISAIAGNCPLMSELNLSYCSNVDDACLYNIVQLCHNLTNLEIKQCAISIVTKHSLCQNFPKLKFIIRE